VALSDIALKGELPEAVANSVAAYVGCIAGAIKIDDYRAGLLAAGFAHVEIVDSGADLNAYAKVENQAGCCSPTVEKDTSLHSIEPACCTPTPEGPECCVPAPADSVCCAPAPGEPDTLHEELAELLSKYDVNAAAASVKVYAIKPNAA
jgi:hypothetical protein